MTQTLQEDFLFFLLLSASCHEERSETSASFQFYFKKAQSGVLIGTGGQLIDSVSTQRY